jgi:hypothetical protein
MQSLQCAPWGGLPAPAAGIQGRRRPDLAGGRCLGLPRTEPEREVASAGRQQGRWQPAAAAVRCARRGLLPGCLARRRAMLEASEGAREGAGVEGRRRLGAEGGVRRRRRLCRPADRKRRGRRVPVRFQGRVSVRIDVVWSSARHWPAGPACMRATCAAAACDGAWPGGPTTGSGTHAWARCSGPGVGRSAHGGAGPSRSLRGAVHRRPGRPRTLERETMAVCPAFISFTGFRNCVTRKSPKSKVVEEL